MVKPRYTSYYGQAAFSDLNRTLGRRIYGIDLDMIAYKYVKMQLPVPELTRNYKEGCNYRELSATSKGDSTSGNLINIDSANSANLSNNQINQNNIDSITSQRFGEAPQERSLTKRIPCAILDAKNGLASEIQATEAHLACCDMAELWNLPYFVVITYLQDMNSNDLENPMLYIVGINELAQIILPDNGKIVNRRGTWMTVLEYSIFHHKLRGLDWNGEEMDLDSGLRLKELPNKHLLNYKLPKLYI